MNPWPYYTNSGHPSTTYGLNGLVFPYNWGNTSNNTHTRRMRDTRLLAPSETLFMGELPNGDSAITGFPGSFEDNHVNGILFHPTYASWWYTEVVCRHGMVAHDMSWNSLMCDGHVENHKKIELVRLASETSTPGSKGKMFWWNSR